MKNILLVEGLDDQHVIKNLCGKHSLPWFDDIKEHGGYTELLDAIPIRLKESDIGSLGIVIDADTDIGSRWQAIRDRLVKVGYETPSQPSKDGLIVIPPVETLLPKVGVWLMPDNAVSGILEDFIRRLVPTGDRLFAYAEKCVDGIASSQRLFRDLDLPKVNIHTWLAWQADPGKPLGQAIMRGTLDARSPQALEFVEWLKKLFVTG
jgi:hypothetical protein